MHETTLKSSGGVPGSNRAQILHLGHHVWCGEALVKGDGAAAALRKYFRHKVLPSHHLRTCTQSRQHSAHEMHITGTQLSHADLSIQKNCRTSHAQNGCSKQAGKGRAESTCCARKLRSLVLCKDADAHRFTGAVGQRDGAPHLLVPPPRVCTQVEGNLHRLIEPRVRLGLRAARAARLNFPFFLHFRVFSRENQFGTANLGVSIQQSSTSSAGCMRILHKIPSRQQSNTQHKIQLLAMGGL